MLRRHAPLYTPSLWLTPFDRSMPPADGLKAHVELSRISCHIVCNTYRISPSEDAARPVRSLEGEISMLDEWCLKLPPTVQLASNGLSDDPATCLLHMHYNQAISPFSNVFWG